MPKEIKDVKKFMELLVDEKPTPSGQQKTHRPKNTFEKSLTVKKNNKVTKFKLRTRKYLITFQTTDQKVVKKVLSHLPSSIKKTEVKNKKISKKSK